MNEFDIIEKYFHTQKQRSDVILGIGDDAALLKVPKDAQLVVTTDTLVSDVHFFANDEPYHIGYKALAVNLSDLASMGATPAWATLSLTLPQEDHNWLKAFSSGFFELANRYDVSLIGGDLTKGPLTITILAMGYVTEDALLRSGAKVGDFIYVTGTLGDAALAIQSLKSGKKRELIDHHYLQKLYQPQPRIEFAKKLKGIANSAIDISDGLVGDLRHILEKSKVGAILYVDQLPMGSLNEILPLNDAIQLALTGGDDYELCYTVPADKIKEMNEILSNQSCNYSKIGVITDTNQLLLQFANGKSYETKLSGYQHF